MGCTCSRAQQSEDKSESRTNKNNYNETDLGNTSYSKYVKISNDTDSNNRENQTNDSSSNETSTKNTASKKSNLKKRFLNKSSSTNNDSTNQSKNSQKQSANNSLLKPFTILFQKDKRSSSNTLNDSQYLNDTNQKSSGSCQESNAQQSLFASQNQSNLNLNDSNRNSSSQFRPTSQSPQSVYSIYNLPIRTQYLLNSHDNIEKLNIHTEQASEYDGTKPNNIKKLNSEIQVYISLPYYVNDIHTISDNVLKSNLNLLDKHLCEEYVNAIKDTELANSPLFDYLRIYCAQHKTNNCDLNLINLNNYRRKANLDNNNSKFDLLNNKYFRRSLGVTILNDLFNIKSSNNFFSHHYNSFLSSFSVFVIYLSESQIEQETLEDLLCPDQIEINDFKTILEKKLQASNLMDLFQKYYKLDKNFQSYRLDVDFFNSDCFLDDLDRLYDFFCKLEIELLNPNETNFRTKYLKSIQQQEIEIIVKNADPQSIIWVHMTKSDSIFNRSNSVDFNYMRYTSVLNLLQSKVLTNKYKHFSSENLNSSTHGTPQNVLNDFIYNSVKSLVDSFAFELTKNQHEMIALKIDKQLSKEIFKHYNYFTYLSKINYSNASFYKLESMLHEYLNDKTSSYKHPFVIYNDIDENSSTNRSDANTCFNILMSKWLNKLIENNQKLADFNSKTTIIYRYCSHSILSSDLITLLQSILHQLCYIIEIHESCAFDCPEQLVENISKGLETYFSKSENSRKNILIVLNNLDTLIKSNQDCLIVEKFIKNLYSNIIESKIKIVITLSSISSSKLFIDNMDSYFSHTSKKSVTPIDLNLHSSIKTQLTKLNKLWQNSKLQKMFNLMSYLLNNSRYGIKQSEFLDLIAVFGSLLDLDQTEISYNLSFVWYAIKYFTNSVEIINETNQIMYKMHIDQDQDQNEIEYSDLVYMFYNRSDPKLSQRTKLIASFTNRVFHELPKSFYLSNNENSEFKKSYLEEFILNPKWILNKSFICSSILYVLHDINFYKSIDTTPNEQLKKIENFLYKNLYNLNQDQNQLYLITKLDSNLENMLKNLDFINKSNNLNAYPQFFRLSETFYDKNKLFHLDHLNKELNYFSKVLYLCKGYFLTLSENTNEIKIWKLVLTSFLDHKLDLIRTIKFNKTPKDIRLINKHTAIVLVERNLHLIDLNKCAHIYDLNSTMSPNFAFFELHDSNHVVLLARNRLSVILMKLPTNTNDTDNSENDRQPLLNSSCNNDNMFLFKVGEDRYLNSLLVSKNGKIMVCGDDVQKPFPLLVWNLNQRKLVYDLRQAKHEFITSISSISSSGKYVVSACQEEGELKNCLIVYDLTTGQLYKKLKSKENFVCVEISEEANVIIACLENSQIFVYNLEDGSKKFAINSNRFPVNKIKLLDTNEHFKNFFITYDTSGYDLTIRLWDLTKGDQLISSITCPCRIVSLDVNSSTLYFDNMDENKSKDCETNDQLFITACLFGIKELFIVKLDYFKNKNKNIQTVFNSYCDDESLNGLNNEINI